MAKTTYQEERKQPIGHGHWRLLSGVNDALIVQVTAVEEMRKAVGRFGITRQDADAAYGAAERRPALARRLCLAGAHCQ